MKRVTTIIVSLFVLLLALMVIVPYLYQDDIKEMLKKELNNSVDARVDFDDISLSLFKSFPDLFLEISGLSFQSLDTTKLDTIAYAEQIVLDLDVMTVIRKDETVLINGLHLISPIFNLMIDATGASNFDIIKSTKPSNTATDSSAPYRINLSNYSVRNANISYIDRESETTLVLPDFNHSGDASYIGAILTLNTKSNSTQTDVSISGIKYLAKADLNLGLNLLIDLDKNEYKIDKADLKINELLVVVQGIVDVNEEDMLLDLSLLAPGNEFKELWSIVPLDFKGDLKDLKTKGKFNLDGIVKGKYISDSGSLPSMELNIVASEGAVSYSGLPQELREIDADISFFIDEGSGNQRLNIKKLNFKAGQSVFVSKAELNKKNGSQYLNGLLRTNLNLQDLPLEDDLNGLVNADVRFKGFLNDIINQAYDRFDLNGSASLDDIEIQMKDMPLIQIDASELFFSPQKISSNDVALLLGKSDFSGSVDIIDPLGFVVSEISPKLYLNGNGRLLDVDEWLAGDSDATKETAEVIDEVATDLLPFGLEFNSDIGFEEVRYGEYNLKDVKGSINIIDQNVSIPSSSFRYAGNDLSLSMKLNQVSDYIYRSENLNGNIKVKGQKFDLDRYMSDSESEVTIQDNAEPTQMETVVLPEDMDLDIDVDFIEVLYGKINMKNVIGQLTLDQQQLDLSNVVADVFGGKMKLIGSFLSNGLEPAAFNIKYDVIKLPFEGVYSNILTIQQLSPLAEYIKGIFNSTFVVSGKLMDDMMPDLASLTASGYIETIEGKLAQLPFVDKLGKALAVSELAGIVIEDSKNWFEIKDGEFIIEPFEFEYKGIALKVSGKTSLDQSMNMDLELDVPKDMIDKIPGSEVLDRGLSWTQSEASKLGIQVNEVNSFKFGVDLSGQIIDPEIKVKLLGAGDKTVKERLTEERKNLEKVVRDSLEKEKERVVREAKDKAEKEVEKLKDTVTARVKEESKKVVDKAKEEAKKKLNEVIDSTTKEKVVDELEKKAEEILGDDEKIDELKKKLDDFNPFKKKKK